MNVLIIVGTAPCCKDDLRDFIHLYDGRCDFMAAGKDAAKLPIFWAYVATGHAEDIPDIQKTTAGKIIHYEQAPGVDIVQAWDITGITGSSAHLGALAALALGYKKIVLCGCPLHGPNPGHPGADYKMFQDRWIQTKEVLLPYVRSMSGFTKGLLGAPEKDWL